MTLLASADVYIGTYLHYAHMYISKCMRSIMNYLFIVMTRFRWDANVAASHLELPCAVCCSNLNILFKLVSYVMSNVAWTGRCGSQEEKPLPNSVTLLAKKNIAIVMTFCFADLLTVSVKVEGLIMLLLVRLSISRRHYTFESSNELNY